MVYFVVALCVLGLVAGQLMFKLSAVEFINSGSYFSIKPVSILVCAMGLYSVTSIAWVWVLQKTDLGRVYPFMALAFVLVPVGSYFIFEEKYQPQYFLGVILIVLGILVAVRS